ncbi:MAG: hypothetical protein JWL91_2509 [Sphingomonas bacterium]|nr:hypothetical protein [Sphingomonas bacterium]MDB5690633.1 hypothetical protein [Sphingomonas bacterium]
MVYLRWNMGCGMAAAALLIAAPAIAQDEGAFRLGVTGGTLGIGPEAAYRFSANAGVRTNATFLSISHGFDSDDIEYDGKVKLRSAGVMLDVFPFGGGFFVSGGARINGNKGRAVATPTAAVEINGTTYTPAQIGTLRGRAETKNFAPQLTLGFGGAMGRGFYFGTEGGALFQGRVRLPALTSSGNGVGLADLDAERADLEDDIDDYKIYPIVQLRIGYRF